MKFRALISAAEKKRRQKLRDTDRREYAAWRKKRCKR